jgi:putative ABC transport system permease protein
MNLRRSIGPSLAALFAHRVRATLAVAGVTAGVAAFVLAGAIGAGAEADIRSRIENIGANLLVVRPAQVKRFVARKDVKGTVTTLRVEDLEAISALQLVADVVPGIETPVKVKAGSSTATTKVLGTAPAFPLVRRFEIAGGRFFDAADDREAARVAVLGSRVADALFEHDPIGEAIRIRGVPFEIIGVLAAKGVVAGGDEDNQIVIPIRTALRRVFNATWLTTIFVRVTNSDMMPEAEREIAGVLRQRHRIAPEAQADFDVQNATTFLMLQQETAATLRRLTTGVAAIALAIGGTGILALMLLSVRERTSEIGLRMAVGAQPRDILVQFLFEATLLALGGWTAGVIVAAVGARGIALGIGWNLAVAWGPLVLSLGMALTIGLGFGVVPARRASLILPIHALSTA